MQGHRTGFFNETFWYPFFSFTFLSNWEKNTQCAGYLLSKDSGGFMQQHEKYHDGGCDCRVYLIVRNLTEHAHAKHLTYGMPEWVYLTVRSLTERAHAKHLTYGMPEWVYLFRSTNWNFHFRTQFNIKIHFT